MPVIPLLGEILEAHRRRDQGAPHDYIFAGDKKGFALQLDNLSRRIIAPKLGERWHGWHGFRRGLATNLYGLRVPPGVIQAVLRYAAVETTYKHYVIISNAQSDSAMKRLAREMKRKGLKWGTNGVQTRARKPRK